MWKVTLDACVCPMSESLIRPREPLYHERAWPHPSQGHPFSSVPHKRCRPTGTSPTYAHRLPPLLCQTYTIMWDASMQYAPLRTGYMDSPLILINYLIGGWQATSQPSQNKTSAYRCLTRWWRLTLLPRTRLSRLSGHVPLVGWLVPFGNCRTAFQQSHSYQQRYAAVFGTRLPRLRQNLTICVHMSNRLLRTPLLVDTSGLGRTKPPTPVCSS
jgi:hypothetical protein